MTQPAVTQSLFGGPHAAARCEGERTAPCPTGPGARCAVCGASAPVLPFTPLELVPLADRRCYRPRLALFAAAGITMEIRRAAGLTSPEVDIAEWHLVGVRRRHLEACWADEATVAS